MSASPESFRGRRVVGIGALSDLDATHPDCPRTQSFRVDEFVDLDDGRRVVIDHRGFTTAINRGSVRDGFTVSRMRQEVLNVVLPDSDEEAERQAHPWEWLAECANQRGIAVTADELKQFDYQVVLSDELVGWLESE